mgnify:CR=1 FL=1
MNPNGEVIWMNQYGGLKMFDDKEIKRMTIVYTDGSMTILSKNKKGSMTVQRREK